MSTNAQWALQKALLELLNADPALGTFLGTPLRVYDSIPVQAEFPFVTFERANVRPIKADRDGALEHQIILKVWSRYDGRREALEVLNALRILVDDAALSLDGHYLVSVRTVFSDVFRVRSSRVFEAVLSLRAVTEPLI